MEAFEIRQNVGEPTYIRIEGDWARYDRLSVDGSVCFVKDLPQLKTYECPCDYLYSAAVSDEEKPSKSQRLSSITYMFHRPSVIVRKTRSSFCLEIPMLQGFVRLYAKCLITNFLRKHRYTLQ
jgi:hypothetical protein